MKKLVKFAPLLSLLVIASPLVAYAQVSPSNTLTDIIRKVSDLFRAVLPLLIGLGVIYFVWGVVQFVIADSDEAKTKGRDRIIYGIIGLAVVTSVWGLVALLRESFGITSTAAPTVNLIGTTGGGCTLAPNPTLQDYMNYFTNCIINNSLIPLLFALAVMAFIWGVINFFIIGGEEETKKNQGKQFMLWGIIALAVMLSVWGLVGILRTTFGLGSGSVLPQVHP